MKKILAVVLGLLLAGCAATGAQNDKDIYYQNNLQEKCGFGVEFANTITNEVGKVRENSAAEKAGIVQGDLITGINGVSTFARQQLTQQLQNFTCGDEVTVSVMNATKTPVMRDLKVTIDTFVHRFMPVAKKLHWPSQYPEFQPNDYIRAINISLATEAKQKARNKDPGRGYALGAKNFEGEAGKKFLTHVFLGVQIGKTILHFGMVTPYSEAAYWSYAARKQFVDLSVDDIVISVENMNYALIYVSQNSFAENLIANTSGFGSLVGITTITQVLIKTKHGLYPSVGKINGGWAFPLELFGPEDDFEIIAVSNDNLHCTIKPSAGMWAKIK